jgi:hypothetical protein
MWAAPEAEASSFLTPSDNPWIGADVKFDAARVSASEWLPMDAQAEQASLRGYEQKALGRRKASQWDRGLTSCGRRTERAKTTLSCEFPFQRVHLRTAR